MIRACELGVVAALGAGSCVSSGEPVTRTLSTQRAQVGVRSVPSGPRIRYEHEWHDGWLVLREYERPQCVEKSQMELVSHVEIRTPHAGTYWPIGISVLGAYLIADPPVKGREDPSAWVAVGAATVLGALVYAVATRVRASDSVEVQTNKEPLPDDNGPPFYCGEETRALRSTTTLLVKQDDQVIDRRIILSNSAGTATAKLDDVILAKPYCRSLTLEFERVGANQVSYQENVDDLSQAEARIKPRAPNTVARLCCVAAHTRELSAKCTDDCATATSSKACYVGRDACSREGARDGAAAADTTQICDQLLADCLAARGTSVTELFSCSNRCAQVRAARLCATEQNNVR